VERPENSREMHLVPATEEIIDRKELSKRSNISEPTVIRWEKKKMIPAMRIGSAVRYN
jgi:predicted DNA-binding transcriptional regulator AlpA